MIKGILFDKDGTLIDFSLWRDAGINAVKEILREYGLNNDESLYNRLIKSIGIEDNGVDPFGALAFKTHGDVAGELYFILNQHNLNLDFNKFNIHVSDLLRREVLREDVEFKQLTNLKELFGNLKRYDIKIGLSTADVKLSALHFINKFDISEYFDFIGSRDGILKPKPHKDMCVEFCEKCGLQPYEVAIVGDSHIDMLFARNSGALAVGVLSGVSSKYNLKDVADVILPSVDCLFENGNMILQNYEEEKFEGNELCTA